MFIALTGGIGCGKTTALHCFAHSGCQIFDCDAICHALLARPDVEQEIATCFAKELPAGEHVWSRKLLAELVFSQEYALRKLTDILYPKLHVELSILQKQFHGNSALGCVEVPLLFEEHLEVWFDTTIAVWSPEPLRRKRLLEQRQWTLRECEQREQRQWSADAKLEKAHFGIINHGTVELLQQQCDRLCQTLRQSAAECLDEF